MKKVLFIFALMINFSIAFSQSTNLIFFTEEGEKFYVVLNSVLQNQQAETNVKVTDLMAPSYKLKIIFKDSTIVPLEKSLMYKQGTETTFNIKKNSKGEYVVRYLSEVPMAQSVPPIKGQSVIIYSASGPSAPVTTTISTTQTTSTTSGNSNPAGVSMGVNVDGTSMNVNINTSGTALNNATTSTTYSTTTTSTTTSSNVVQPPSNPGQQPYALPGYSGPIGCPLPMSPNDFEAAKNTISSKSFEDSKLAIAKQIFASNCLLSSQVREIMKLFSFEDSRLEFAKYAYGYTFDLGNYFKVNDAFTFESSIDELNTYIAGIHK
jgi:hypothetical protein